MQFVVITWLRYILCWEEFSYIARFWLNSNHICIICRFAYTHSHTNDFNNLTKPKCVRSNYCHKRIFLFEHQNYGENGQWSKIIDSNWTHMKIKVLIDYIVSYVHFNLNNQKLMLFAVRLVTGILWEIFFSP